MTNVALKSEERLTMTNDDDEWQQCGWWIWGMGDQSDGLDDDDE